MSSSSPSNGSFTLPGGNPAAVAGRILSRTRATQAKLVPAIAVLTTALAAAGRPVPGLAPDETLPLKFERIGDGLAETFAASPELADEVAGQVTRFVEATWTLEGFSGDGDLEGLKQAAFFLSRFHEGMQGDPLLAQLFPAPQLLQAEATDAATI